MNFKEITKKYEENYFAMQKLDDLLEEGTDFDSWLTYMKKRASMLKEYYTIDNQLIDSIKEYASMPFEYENEPLELEEEIYRLYDNYMMDSEFLLPLIEKLIRFYEPKKEITKLIEFYYISFYL